MSGWGLLHERRKNSSAAGCLTDEAGPAKFTRCRDRFVYGGTMMVTRAEVGL